MLLLREKAQCSLNMYMYEIKCALGLKTYWADKSADRKGIVM